MHRKVAAIVAGAIAWHYSRMPLVALAGAVIGAVIPFMKVPEETLPDIISKLDPNSIALNYINTLIKVIIHY